MKVLVVDDVGYSRHFHTRLLEKFGYEVETAESGAQALKLLERDPTIGAVLTDLMMREMDGVELYQHARTTKRQASGSTVDVPSFILMTALRPGGDQSQQKDVEKVRMAKEIGFAEVLFKPIEPAALKKALNSIEVGRQKLDVDVAGTVRTVGETIDRLIAAGQHDAAGSLLDQLRPELDRLEEFAMQSA